VKVLHVYKDVHPEVSGGIERHIDELRRSVPGTVASVLVCSGSSRTRLRYDEHGLCVGVGEFGRPLSTPLSPAFPYWLKRIEADLLHLHAPNPTGELAALVARDGRPMVVSYHADIVRQALLLPIYRHLVERVLDSAGAIVTGTHALKASSTLLSRHRDQVDVIPYAVDTLRFSPEAVDQRAVSEVRVRFGGKLVLATGRLVYYKGFERLIELAPRLDATVVIAGSGPLAERLREQASGVPNVHMTGRIDDDELRVLLAAADVFVLPSTNRAESFGIATLEAQSMGTPAVVTDVGTGTVEAIEHGTTGLVVPARDDAALVGAIQELLADDKRRTAMGRAARLRVVSTRGMDTAAEQFAALYDRVMQSAR
jgi:glycosyltransferase involved in cell wall biosynthesis